MVCSVVYHRPMDRSTGCEAIAPDFLKYRGRNQSTGIGVEDLRRWARRLPRGSSVIDVACGLECPFTAVLVKEGLQVFGIVGSPSFVGVFQGNLPGSPVRCEAVQESAFFDRTFDAVLAWGMFLLPTEDQQRLIQRFAELLLPGGRLHFTSTADPVAWVDVMTGLESPSLGAEQYRKLLEDVGIAVAEEFEDDGKNHYFDAFKATK